MTVFNYDPDKEWVYRNALRRAYRDYRDYRKGLKRIKKEARRAQRFHLWLEFKERLFGKTP